MNRDQSQQLLPGKIGGFKINTICLATFSWPQRTKCSVIFLSLCLPSTDSVLFPTFYLWHQAFPVVFPSHPSLTCLSNYSPVSRLCSCCLSPHLQPISHQLKWERIDSSSIGLKQAPSSSPTCICFFPFTTKCTDSSSNTSNLLKFQNPPSLALIKMFLVVSLLLSPAVLPSSYSLQAPFTLSYNLVPIYLEFFAFHDAMLPFLAGVQEDKTPQGSGTAFALSPSTTLPRLSISSQTFGLTTTVSPASQTHCCAFVLLCSPKSGAADFPTDIFHFSQIVHFLSISHVIYPSLLTTIVVITHTSWRSSLTLLLIDIGLCMTTFGTNRQQKTSSNSKITQCSRVLSTSAGSFSICLFVFPYFFIFIFFPLELFFSPKHFLEALKPKESQYN